ncbi:hypothetical protein U1Q18_004381 [Sarracenia purpurea var. burkii]
MASGVSMLSAGFSYGGLGLRPSRAGGATTTLSRPRNAATAAAMVVVRAEAINPEIRKSEAKVVDSVVVSELSKPLTAYCRFAHDPDWVIRFIGVRIPQFPGI